MESQIEIPPGSPPESPQQPAPVEVPLGPAETPPEAPEETPASPPVEWPPPAGSSGRALLPAPASVGADPDVGINRLRQLLEFLARLDTHAIGYSLTHDRAEAITVRIVAPGERWEVGFLADGTMDVEVFVGVDGVVSGAKAAALLDQLFSPGGSDA